jgi:hypothetical protein
MTQQPDPNFRNGRKRRVVHPKVEGFADPNLKYPSLAQQAKNLAGTAKQIMKNPKVATEDLYEKRMKICRECAFFDHEQVRCRKCGCKLKGKARFEGAKCPISKW